MATTLLALYRALGHELNDLAMYPASAGAATTVTLAMLVNATVGASTERYNGRNVYCNAQQRVVRTSGYAPSTGVLTVFPSWVTPPTAAQQVILTSMFPVIQNNDDSGFDQSQSDDLSYRTIINRALALLALPDRVRLTITRDYAYSTTTWPWLDRPERLRRILEPGVRGDRPVDASWRGWDLVLDANTPIIEFDVPFEAATGTLTLEVSRPANTWIATGGVWAETAPSSGLVNDTDQTLAEIEDVLPAAKMIAYEALLRRAEGRPPGPLLKAYETARADAEAGRYWDRSQQSPQQPQAPVPTVAA